MGANTKIKCISLWQPWASLMGRYKTIETRHWYTNYRGLLAIHAAKRSNFFEESEVLGDIVTHVHATYGAWPNGWNHWLSFVEQHACGLPRGAIVAVAELVACRPTNDAALSALSSIEYACGNYGPGRFGWQFDKIVPLPATIPLRGQQGLFDLPDDIARQCALAHDLGMRSDNAATLDGREHRGTPG